MGNIYKGNKTNMKDAAYKFMATYSEYIYRAEEAKVETKKIKKKQRKPTKFDDNRL